MKFRNPLPFEHAFELQVNDMRLLTDGVVFESVPESVVLQSNETETVSLFGTPLEVGDLELNGYSTHTLGVKSNCRLKHMLDRSFPMNYKINVVSAMPTIDIKSSLPTSTQPAIESVICTAKASLFNGETQQYEITITNTSNISVEYFDADLVSTMDSKQQARMFQFNSEEIKANLPLLAGQSFSFKLKVYGDADFIGVVSGTPIPPMSSLTHHQSGNNGPSSLKDMNNYPSRVSSPIRRNNENSSSFRSTSTISAVNSGHSSLQTLSLGAMINAGNQARQLEAQMKFRYSGGNGLSEGYCRECSLAFTIELLPSIQVTSWDVLPAEV